MQVLSASPVQPRADRVGLVVERLKRGGVVALPTETFYGLAADCFNRQALVRVNELKGKERDSPILLLLGSPEQARSVAAELPPRFVELAERFWPGPLTLVVRASADLPREVDAGRKTVAVRVPGLALPRCIANGLGRPITGVSANRTGEPPCRNAAEVARVFGDGLDLIVDAGPSPGGAPSTILDITGARPRIVREGLLPMSALSPFLEDG